MKRKAPHGFTLIEMITVVAVIIILAGLVISVTGLVNQKANRTKAEGEMKAFTNALDAYKNDNGIYPRTEETDKLDPRVDVSPTAGKYTRANLALYSALTGDFEPKDSPDGKPESKNKNYHNFNPTQLSATKDNTGGVANVRYISDPWGNPYGYSTAAVKIEEEYREDVRKNPIAPRPTDLEGYNPTFDLWSTAGATTLTQKAKWVRNWAE
ncbi:MAG TPA: type II secretion system protein GspG [Chthoniobacteraceae bacterium]|jgi:prepilin-type N-terminal cleavage/methylation domain-containing protein|nr:type II secretion system protein GspG [Chthoniobacteraceae bacterium]